MPVMKKKKVIIAAYLKGFGGGTAGWTPLTNVFFFHYLFGAEFLHRQDRLLLFNWLSCSLLERY